jgi:proteasome accessory factor A
VPPILCGLDTEYGLLVEGRGAEDQIDDATAFVRASPDGRFVGWDYRGENPRADLRGFRLESLAFDPVDAQFDAGRTHAAPHEIRADRVLANGARFYNDHGHPEYATPECRSIFELARQDREGETFMLRAAQAYAAETDREVRVYKNNTDFHGASYGTHESYLVPRSLGFEPLFAACVPMLVARQILVGAGKVGSETGTWVDYQLSQRADFFVEAANAETLYRRPVFNTRDEPHGDGRRWIRLHVIAGDANMIPAATARKAGLLKLALELAKAGEPALFKLADPVRAFMDVSRDSKHRFEIKLVNGSWTTADEIIEGYLSAAESRLELGAEERWTIDTSRRLLGQLRSDFDAFRREVDWAAKLHILEQAELDFKDPALRAYDLEYHNPDPDEGLHSALVSMGEVDDRLPLFQEEGTRALARSIAVRKFADQLATVSWRSLVFKTGEEIALEPDVEYPATLEDISDVETFIQTLRGLQGNP